MADIIKCKDCIYLERWRFSEDAKKHGQLYYCGLLIITNPSLDDYCSKAESEE